MCTSKILRHSILLLLALHISREAESLAGNTFSVPVSGHIWSLAIQADQKTLLGGLSIASIAGQPSQNLARLNVDGSLDSSFFPVGASDVTSIAVQTDGSILTGDYITNLAGQTCTNLALIAADGLSARNFASPNPNGAVWAFAFQPDGKLLLAGEFDVLSGNQFKYIARLNADYSLDTTFRPTADIPPTTILVQSDGKILLGGTSLLNGQVRNGIGRLNPDGTSDETFKTDIKGPLWSMALQSDGKILASFPRQTIGTVSNICMGKLNNDGSLDTNFTAAANAAITAAVVTSFAPQADGRILEAVNGKVLRLNADGTLDVSLPSSNFSGVLATALRTDGEILTTDNSVQVTTNSEESHSTLNYRDGTASWSFGNTSPDVPWAAFDYSVDGISWTNCGMGTHAALSWQVSGLSLPTNSILRAHSAVNGGYYNSSTWPVFAFYGRPVILLQPASITNYLGIPTRLSVSGGGSEPLYYQWLKDGVPIVNGTNTDLSIGDLTPSSAGGYSVLVSNQFGFSLSSIALVRGVPDPEIITNDSGFGISGGSFGFSLRVEPNRPFVIESTANFINWQAIETNSAANSPYYFRDKGSPVHVRKFYRVRALR